jgi:hypothetical protein
MLTDIHIMDVAPGQTFHYAGRTYVLALEEEEDKHPAVGMGQVLAYHTPDRGDRVPVSFSTQVRVFVERGK